MFELYTYWRSSAAYRVRIGLALKRQEYKSIPTHLLRNGGEHRAEQYATINPQMLIPALALSENQILTQSLAILEYLDETYPEPAFYPVPPIERARARAFVHSIAMDIHPINNLRVLKYLKDSLDVTDEQQKNWYQHWINTGFRAAESQLVGRHKASLFCFADAPGMADIFLVPQVYNALRFEVDLTPYPNIRQIYNACMSLTSFASSQPETQPDAQT
ncbi:MAG: maleylacetoacetate isomerase [Gammaproteobacteria bacterium]|nr:maleylacetoacetate isomerase [Gammaproteobacteria bacterium]